MQTYHNSETGEKITCRALNISGKGKLKTIRLTKYALPLAKWVEGVEFYAEAHLKNNRSSNEQTVERHHRVAESVAIIQQSGFEYRPWYLPEIQIENHQCSAINEPSYFLPKVFRCDMSNPSQKYTFSRVVGTLMTPNKTLMVYNTRNAIMKWDGQGESRTKINVENFSYHNTKKGEIDSAIIMGQNLKYVLGLIHQTEKQYRSASIFHKSDLLTMFYNIHYIPLNQFGAKLIHLLTLQNCHNYILSLIYNDESLKSGSMSLNYDIYNNGVYTLSLLDYDMRRLILVKSEIKTLIKEGKPFIYQILCFPEQIDELYQYLGDYVEYLTVNIDELLDLLYEE